MMYNKTIKVIPPKTGTKVEIASGTRRKDCIHAACAIALKLKKNIAALQIKVQKIVLYINVPQK